MSTVICPQKALSIFNIVKQSPGINASSLAKELMVYRTSIYRSLPAMERTPYLLYEDNKGGLYVFDYQRRI